MGYPKVFERPVGAPPEAAFGVVNAWLAENRATVTRATPPRRIEATHGKTFALASDYGAKKILEIDLMPIPNGTLVRVTMPLSKWYFDDGRLLENDVTRTWARFVDSLWMRFGYPPSVY